MQNHIKKHEIFEVAFKKCCELDLKFENAEKYNNALKYTFQRTFNDISQSGKELKILEIGSFTGVVSVALKLYGNFITATDMDFVINDPAIKQLFDEDAISGHSVNLANGVLPFENECFDLIVFNEVLEHLNFNPIPTLREFHRVLVRVECSPKTEPEVMRGSGAERRWNSHEKEKTYTGRNHQKAA